MGYQYRTGTWTPYLKFSNSSENCQYNHQTGLWYRIGGLVHVSCFISIANLGNADGDATVIKLPFDVTAAYAAYTTLEIRQYAISVTSGSALKCYAQGSAIYLIEVDHDGNMANLTHSNFSNYYQATINGMYPTSA